MSLTPDRFAEFFTAANPGKQPFPWQTRVAAQVCSGNWPDVIALPTSAGKTACIDIAIFALACGAPNAPRRIFFVVDRRIVVDQAYEHANALAKCLIEAKSGILYEVAQSLSSLTHEENARPLDVFALRGGMYRESAWLRSPLQPLVITSTVDQVGSRLLFRGYGVSDSMKPVHAGLVGNDSLILLDEAHCSRPFDQTLRLVKRYRNDWHEEEKPKSPFRFVSITATPAKDEKLSIERDNAEDQTHCVLGKRINASKPAKLLVAKKAKGKSAISELAKELEKQASELSKRYDCVGIIVNRVKTARELKRLLGEDAVLLTGRMRPVDRDALLANELAPLLSDYKGDRPKPKFVIGTQCLECGADFDFPSLITECASLDALLQRFGRLNRIAARETCEAVIIIRADQESDSTDDPVYGISLSKTWEWLKRNQKNDVIDFGVASIRALIKEIDLTPLNAPSVDAAILLPAHLDCWVQTHPIPAPDPDPAMFLHGPNRPSANVQVVFRDDLGTDQNQWAEIVALCPPASTEAVSVPIHEFCKWLAGELNKGDDNSSDVEGELREPEDAAFEENGERFALRWKGPEAQETKIVRYPRDIRIGETYILRCDDPGLAILGDFPGLNRPQDCSELAFMKARDKALLRLREFTLDPDEHDDFEDHLSIEIASKEQKIVRHLANESNAEVLAKKIVNHLANKRLRTWQRHPLGGFVITGKRRLHQFDPTYLDDTDAIESFRSGREVSLAEHSVGVANYALKFAKGCGLDAELYYLAGLLHDLGKADRRFQAKLKLCTPQFAVGTLLAKSATFIQNDVTQHQYPRSARHELLSTALAATKTDDDLLLHLIATHHGSARPFADYVEENAHATQPFSVSLFEHSFSLPTSEQTVVDWNPELAERFWRVVRRFGWWGAAFREAVFRLADHAQSREEQVHDSHKPTNISNAMPLSKIASETPFYSTELSGLNGINPLGFLAALGTVKLLTAYLKTDVYLSWNETHTARIHTQLPLTADGLMNVLMNNLCHDSDSHEASCALSLPNDVDARTTIYSNIYQASPLSRNVLDWISSTFDSTNPTATSQLMVVRRDYVEGNFRSILSRATAEHLRRALFETWDYADSLDNQSLHWEPSEDRRHAYQWYQASGDPTRKRRGGMLGANRLALEAWPMFISVPVKDKLLTRGFTGTRVSDTRWSWPLWSRPMSLSTIESLLSISELQQILPDLQNLSAYSIFQTNRCQRILVGKTPNLTPAYAV